MNKKYTGYAGLLFFAMLFGQKIMAQDKKGVNDTIVTYGAVLGQDTLPYFYLQEVAVLSTYLDKNKSDRMARLRYNVMTVWPYAVAAAKVLKDVDIEALKADGRRDKKQYLKSVENQLNAQFKDKLKNLSTTQGSILVKLINRQTGRDCYSIIKELKGGLNARISQTVSYFFDNDLKAQYDPYNKDKDIEAIVQDIESKYYFNRVPEVQIRKIK
ncbi:DUF4294 domain-containing protein [Taibaiella sp. KBW10]|uniref:DUF4294 domain-containing protein n=1 Tax=Taibaiella sp. KBW10 TaxID=2153357 RepID=UPI000F5A626C|nr:DUF4294 domain-containing protein [Taibaiella sp. KBW10]RQO31328.1 DUF4294 domain-containing protein [Taibaiella sp. KBW10]